LIEPSVTAYAAKLLHDIDRQPFELWNA